MNARARKNKHWRMASCFRVLPICCLWASLSAQVSVEMSTGIMTEINGEINIEMNGNWLNDGELISGFSKIVINGNGSQFLRQDRGSFFNLRVEKPAGDVVLDGDVFLEDDTLQIVSGDLELNGYYFELDSTAILKETLGNTVKGTAGYLTTTRKINVPNAANIAGMGLLLTSTDNYGLTEVRRGHAPQAANGSEGILRYFEVFPEFVGSSPLALQFFYHPSELNGNIEPALKLYGSRDSGTTWEELNGTLDTANNSFSTVVADTFYRFTLSSNSLIGVPELSGVFEDPCGILIEAAPNPFYHGSEIRFKLPENYYAELKMFDVSGKLVAQLAKGEYDTEWQEFRLDGTNYADGIYLLHLQTRCGVVSKRVLLQRD